ncbi:hypothetical protein OSB04_003872 [Centaurea solstitialis]|uniref:Protein ALP1-like n=1 Tax=Centaurea solstitialis TaxID=347529 RepID=A0AA38WVU0_9ASTR|nr:hypothetical protein OSB04_003872 [Centaurea solstitialis]
MDPFNDKEFDLIVDQMITNNIRATKLIIQYIENGDAEPSNPRPRGPNKDRGREEGHDKLVADYFSDNPVYNDEDFKRRFRMSRRLFVRIVSDLEREFEYFKQQWDARGVKGFSPLQKCTSAIRQLAYGTASDSMDEYLRMGETTSRECLNFLSRGPRTPEQPEGRRHRGIPISEPPKTVRCGNTALSNFYYSLLSNKFEFIKFRVLHVVNQSPIFNDLFENKAPDSSFVANGTHYNHGYYLADGIYPEWTTFVKAFRYPTEVPRLHFTTRQESARKDIKRTFATLKSKWHVVARPTRVIPPARLWITL